MSNAFYKLDKKKQERIINASLHVFSKNNFKNGSTDIIAYQAQISKGSLFQYFKNKKSLYLFLYEYSLEELEKKAYKHFNSNEKDYFKILENNILVKITLIKEYPYLYDFVVNANEEENSDIAQLIQQVNHKRKIPMNEKLYNNLNYSKFKEGIDFENINKMINWCVEGIWNEGVSNSYSIENMYNQAMSIINFFKNAVYKKEFLCK